MAKNITIIIIIFCSHLFSDSSIQNSIWIHSLFSMSRHVSWSSISDLYSNTWRCAWISIDASKNEVSQIKRFFLSIRVVFFSSKHYLEKNFNIDDPLQIDRFQVGDFCITYSMRDLEFYRARILKINRKSKFIGLFLLFKWNSLVLLRWTVLGYFRWFR